MSEEQEPREREEEEAGAKRGYAPALEAVRPAVAVSNAITAGMLAGLIGGVAQAIWLMILAAVMGMTAWAPLKLISTMVLGMGPMETPGFAGGPVLMGAILHLLIMTLVGGLFALIVRNVGLGSSVILGIVYGLAVWLISQYVLWVLIQPEAALMITGWVAAISLVIYGLVLGWLYPSFRSRYAPR